MTLLKFSILVNREFYSLIPLFFSKSFVFATVKLDFFFHFRRNKRNVMGAAYKIVMQMGHGAHRVSFAELQAYKRAYDSLVEGGLEDPFCPSTVLEQATTNPGRVAVTLSAE